MSPLQISIMHHETCALTQIATNNLPKCVSRPSGPLQTRTKCPSMVSPLRGRQTFTKEGISTLTHIYTQSHRQADCILGFEVGLTDCTGMYVLFLIRWKLNCNWLNVCFSICSDRCKDKDNGELHTIYTHKYRLCGSYWIKLNELINRKTLSVTENEGTMHRREDHRA